jgi:hypothetical protein
LIIKGETIDANQIRVPERNLDPFRKPSRDRILREERRERERMRERIVPVERQYLPPDRYRREVHVEPQVPRIVRIDKAPTPDEAEQKLEELLANAVPPEEVGVGE